MLNFNGLMWLVGAVLLVVLLIALGPVLSRDWRKSGRVVRRAIGRLSVALAVLIALDAVIYGFSTGSQPPVVNVRDIAEGFGLHSGESYPLTLGTRLGGSSVDASATSGFFTATATVSTKPASALSVNFTHGSQSWILEIPVSMITFDQQPGVSPQVTINITDAHYPDHTTVQEEYSPCHFVTYDLIALCQNNLVSRTATLDPHTADQGLPQILETDGVLDYVKIRLTPEMYNKILGG